MTPSNKRTLPIMTRITQPMTAPVRGEIQFPIHPPNEIASHKLAEQVRLIANTDRNGTMIFWVPSATPCGKGIQTECQHQKKRLENGKKQTIIPLKTVLYPLYEAQKYLVKTSIYKIPSFSKKMLDFFIPLCYNIKALAS